MEGMDWIDQVKDQDRPQTVVKVVILGFHAAVSLKEY
jgi:hypothetical protein